MLPQKHQILNIFRSTAHTMKGCHVLLNYPYININKIMVSKGGSVHLSPSELPPPAPLSKYLIAFSMITDLDY